MDVDPVNTLSLSSLQDSTITNVNLYATRAQITRVYKTDVSTGQSKVTITSLPNVVDHESLRYESLCCTVTIFNTLNYDSYSKG